MPVNLSAHQQSVSTELPASQPRTDRQLILATKPFAKDNTLQSWWCVLSTLFLMLAAFGGALWHFHPIARAVCSVFAGLLMLRFFVIYHDQQHHAILPKSRVAEGLMRIFGILALSPSSIWRSSHNHHHNHNSKLRGSQIGSYPIMTREQFIKTSPAKRRVYLFVRHPLTILFGYAFMFLYGMCLNPFFNYPRRHIDCLLALIAHVAIAAALLWFGGWMSLLFVQIIPHFIASAIGSYLFYAQHNFPGVSFNDNAGWTYEKAALESSSYMRMNPLMAWFAGNIGYHHIHHLNARIPFYRLPEVLRALPELRCPKTTSLHPADIARCLRLKVWDVQTQTMVGVRNL
ncbi:MAG TPA: fatty acid desaturase [Verrucomicrobiae bacterium]|jgi:omega-6 fatty acid desaturase (delta-12 desaturase)|nr:fatty acid desaturase [Verrucomicrobiae bacterium]